MLLTQLGLKFVVISLWIIEIYRLSICDSEDLVYWIRQVSEKEKERESRTKICWELERRLVFNENFGLYSVYL